MKKILIISPTPTHAPFAGNRKHILSLSESLRSLGHVVFFLYVAHESFDNAKMRAYWGNDLEIIDRELIYKRPGLLTVIKNKAKRILARYYRRWAAKTGKISKDQLEYNHEVDEYFSPNIGRRIKELQRKKKFEIVICEYVFMSKALEYFNSNVVKVIDAHDKFTDRYQVYLKNGLKPQWVSLYRDQEKKALQRADFIIALNVEETQYFSGLAGRNCITFVSIPPVVMPPKSEFLNTILYFGSDNSINISSLEIFEKEVLSRLVLKNSSVKFLIGGKICDAYRPILPNTIMLGHFEDPADFYALGDVVVNPEVKGTGLKIKSIEAMAYCKPVVATEAGAEGIATYGAEHLTVCRDFEEFSEELYFILNSPHKREQQVAAAIHWLQNARSEMNGSFIKSFTEN